MMKRALLAGIELEYELRGTGEPIAFVHHGAGVEWFATLSSHPELHRFRVLRYHRAGYRGSGTLRSALTFADEAARFQQLMTHLGIQRVHVIGHSASACIALQIALDHPELVQSLVLLEPALMAVPSPPEVPRAIELFRAGEKAAALDTFLRGTCGADYRAPLEAVIPDAIDQALRDADTFFTQELPALRQWTFGPDHARRIHQPVLAVLGERSDVRFAQRHALLREWLPRLESFMLPGAGHLLHVQNPTDMARALADFVSRHAAGSTV